MNKIGMYGGSFNPLHLGHVNDIIKASNMCEKLYVVLSISGDKDEINHKERFMWLKNITGDMSNVEVFEIFDNNPSKSSYNWQNGAAEVKRIINNNIDIVFAGSDYEGKNIWEELYPDSIIEYFSREEINISSTQIRSNPYKYFEYLPKCVQKYYTKKVCVVGTESCGKSTLVRNLAKYFNTNYVSEAGRDICDEAGGIDNMQTYHYLKILLEHKKMEETSLATANKVLLIDTDSLVTLYYYMLGFKDNMNDAIVQIAKNISKLNEYDLYIFLEPDVKWVQDGTRTYGETQIREKNNTLLKRIFEDNNINYASITGNYEQRYEKTKQLIKKII